jgi:hypothetical protein
MINSKNVFKIDNPKNVTIQVKLNENNFVDLDITQSFVYRIEEVKKPVYGFNERNFTKVLSGKTIATGNIVIKKHSKEAILNKLKSAEEETLARQIAAALTNKFDTIYTLLDEANLKDDRLKFLMMDETSPSYVDYKKSNDFFIEQKKKFNSAVLQEQIALRTQTARDNAKNNNYKTDDLLKLGYGTDSITIKVNFNAEQELNEYKRKVDNITNEITLERNKSSDSYSMIFTNVHFVSKEGGIAVGNDDIDEIYSFIANIETN